MEIIKENIITIILITVIIFILIGTGIFCWKIVKSSEQQAEVETLEEQNKTNYNNIGSVENVSNGNVGVDNNVLNNNYIDMSKYYLSYLNTSNENIANIYNRMLDTLEKQKYFIKTSSNPKHIKTTIDFNKMSFLEECDDFYVCWAYTGGSLKYCRYYYSTGKNESINANNTSRKSNEDFVALAIGLEITNDDYEWDYSYNKDILRNGYSCYEIIAEKKFDYISTISTSKLYIDMNTYKLIEIEDTICDNESGECTTSSYYYEYSDGELEIPKEAQEFLKIY